MGSKNIFLLVIVVFSIFARPVFAAELIWQVEHPFRFLKFGSDHRVHELAFRDASVLASFSDRPVSTMESLLNSPDWWAGKREIDTLGGKIDLGDRTGMLSPFEDVADFRSRREGDGTGIGRSSLASVSQIGDAVPGSQMPYGWAALLRNFPGGQPADGTCWDFRNQSYQGCESAASGMRKSDRFGYVMPKQHFVTVKLLGVPDGECEFELAGAEVDSLPKGSLIYLSEDGRETGLTQVKNCQDAELKLQLPYAPSNKTSESAYAFRLIARKLGSDISNAQSEISVVIRINDFVVVSMGDSFSSGEGNPDMPAILDDELVQIASFGFERVGEKLTNYQRSNTLGFPRRTGDTRTVSNASSAKWIDRRCHRSMYGAPTRAAIALAFAGDRHHAITYLNFACSGAEVTDGLFWPQSGVECASNNARGTARFMEPQLSGVVRELSLEKGGLQYYPIGLHEDDRFLQVLQQNASNRLKFYAQEQGYCEGWPGVRDNQKFSSPLLHTAYLERDIDVLFLSIAGNDTGFSPLIVNATLNRVYLFPGTTRLTQSNPSLLTKMAREAVGGISTEIARKRLKNTLPNRLEVLHQAIRGKLEISDQKSKVIISQYPSLTRMKNGKYCGVGESIPRQNLGMSISPFFLFNDEGTPEIDAKDAEAIVSDLNAQIKASADGKWKVVNPGDRFIGHSICDQRKDPELAKSETFLVPRKSLGAPSTAWMTDNGLKINPYTDYRHYNSRQTWFRSLNHAYMGVHQYKRNAADERNARNRSFLFDADAALFNALRALGGPFHPSAEGHAAMADELTKAAMETLDLNWKD